MFTFPYVLMLKSICFTRFHTRSYFFTFVSLRFPTGSHVFILFHMFPNVSILVRTCFSYVFLFFHTFSYLSTLFAQKMNSLMGINRCALVCGNCLLEIGLGCPWCPRTLPRSRVPAPPPGCPRSRAPVLPRSRSAAGCPRSRAPALPLLGLVARAPALRRDLF